MAGKLLKSCIRVKNRLIDGPNHTVNFFNHFLPYLRVLHSSALKKHFSPIFKLLLLNRLKKNGFCCFVFKKLSYIVYENMTQGNLNPKKQGRMPKSQTSRPNQNQQTIMEKLGFHKSKLYSLILAAVVLISMILPWITVKAAGGFGMGMSRSQGGFGSWGLLALAGIALVAAACFMGDKSKPFDELGKKLALGGFGAIAGGAVIYLIRILTIGGGKYGGFVKISPGIGLFLGLAAGAIGLLLLLGIVKVPKSIDDKVG